MAQLTQTEIDVLTKSADGHLLTDEERKILKTAQAKLGIKGVGYKWTQEQKDDMRDKQRRKYDGELARKVLAAIAENSPNDKPTK